MGARGIIQSDIIMCGWSIKVMGARGIIQCDITCAAGLLKSWGPGV